MGGMISLDNDDTPPPACHTIVPFDAKQWAALLHRPVKLHAMPKALVSFLESPCPIWKGKLVKETHIVFGVPTDLTVSTLFKSLNHSTLLDIWDHRQPAGHWVAMTREILPKPRFLSWTQQQEQVGKVGYRIPSVVEAACGIVCAEAQTVRLFGNRGFTRCLEAECDWPAAVGHDSWSHFSIYTNDANELFGVAGVRRF
jgi:hypothetical protein